MRATDTSRKNFSNISLPAPHEMKADTTDYIGPAVYRNGQPDMVRYTGGYASLSKSGTKYVPTFHHYITDYLGNNRAVVRASDGAFVQITHYYPWGSVYGDTGTGASLQPYKYGDKELDLTAGVTRYDYAARAYFAAIPRFDRPDALAGKYPHISPYAFCANNPVNVVDPTGMNWVSTNTGDGHEIWTWNEDVSSLEEAKKLGYSDYRSNGSIIDNARIGSGDYGSVYLGFSSDDRFYTTSNKEAGPWRTGWEWLSGTGPRNREFHDGDYFAEMLRKHPHYQDAIHEATAQIKNGVTDGKNDYQLGGWSGIPKYLKDYSTLFTFGMTGNLAVTYLGSYRLDWKAEVKGNTAIIHVKVKNTSTMQSATRLPVLGYTERWQNSIGKMINEFFFHRLWIHHKTNILSY